MDEVLSEVESRRIAFKQNPLEFTKKHSLINKCTSIDIVEGKKNNKSVLDLYGVRFAAGSRHYYFCVLGDCFLKRQIIGINKGSTGNATLHLSAMHNFVAGKTQAHQRNVEKLATYIEKGDKSSQRTHIAGSKLTSQHLHASTHCHTVRLIPQVGKFSLKSFLSERNRCRVSTYASTMSNIMLP